MVAVVRRGRQRAGSLLAGARRRYRWLDHLVRAYGRFSDQRGNQLAGAVTYFGFLSFFPLLAVAFAVLVYVVVVYPDARAQVQDALRSAFPGLIGTAPGRIDLSRTAAAGTGAGVLGLLGLLYSGTGWVDALRAAIRQVWLRPAGERLNVVVRKIRDGGVLVAFGVALVASVAVSSLATSATRILLDLVGLTEVPGAGVGLRIVAVLVAVAFDAVLFGLLFGILPGVRTPLPLLARGALFGAVGFEVLKLVGTYLVGRTTSNPVYGTFAIVVGLLVWINLVSRITVFAAAWTATGLPVEEGADDPLALSADLEDRLDGLPTDRLRRPVDAEALLYHERSWADTTLAGRERAAYVQRVAERLREVGHPFGEHRSGAARPGSFRDLVHQVRVARRSRRFARR